MSKIAIYNAKGKETSSMTLGADFAKKRINTSVIYQAVNNYLASGHSGTHKTKNRREVSGGGKKPWRQKGTGRARFGSSRNPLWRGGGTAFGPKVRGHAYAVPRKVKKLALIEAVRSRVNSGNAVVFDSITIEKPRTKEMQAVTRSLKVGDNCLFVFKEVDQNLRLASRNMPYVAVKSIADVNALDVLRYDKLAISEESLKSIIGEGE